MPKSFTYKYPRPMVTVDLVVFGLSPDGLRTLFIRRKKDPFAGMWAIPGGYLEMDETFETGARRELQEEAGLSDLSVVEEIGTFGTPGRDPRGRTISIAFAGIARGPLPEVSGSDDASEAEWLDPDHVGSLAFDHAEILAEGRQWLDDGLHDRGFFFELLPHAFDKRELGALLKVLPGRKKSAAKWIEDAIRSRLIEPDKASRDQYRLVIGRDQ